MDNPRHPDDTIPSDQPEASAEQRDRLAWEVEMIAEALASAKAGLVVDEAAVDAWIDSLGTEHGLPVPYPSLWPRNPEARRLRYTRDALAGLDGMHRWLTQPGSGPAARRRLAAIRLAELLRCPATRGQERDSGRETGKSQPGVTGDIIPLRRPPRPDGGDAPPAA
jgi:hypothetical protein